MPDRTSLKVGNVIRLLCVPEGDLQQRERELSEGAEDAGSTADAIERIIREDPIVTIRSIERDTPWFERAMKDTDGMMVYHSIAILDDQSWELVTKKSRRKR